MKILITGVAGFVGFNFAQKLLQKKYEIYGIDNINHYYNPKIKIKRIAQLKKKNNFYFTKLDIVNRKKLRLFFIKNKINYVFHFAAQAGVRYSIEHPRKYIVNNIDGFYNIIENCRDYKVNRLFYASSSSVYGENVNFPLKETEVINPKNIYGLSKKNNEEIAKIFSDFYQVKSVGLRFFTIFGEWGRPDMFIIKYLNAFREKKPFFLNNFGNHDRDFTYIQDVVLILEKLFVMQKKLKKYEIFNICSNKPINLKTVINYFVKLGIKPKLKKIKMQQADIKKTHGCNRKIINFTKFNQFTNWKKSLSNTYNWWKLNNLY